MDGKDILEIVAVEAGKEIAKQAVIPIVTKAKERIPKVFAQLRERLEGAALTVADKRIEEFDTVLTEACDRQAEQASRRGVPVVNPIEAVADPDNYHAFRSTINSVARTSSAERRKMLADALAMRLQLQTETERAVISNRAIETMPQLSQPHLELLGLLAVLFALLPKRPDEYESIASEYYALYHSVVKAQADKGSAEDNSAVKEQVKAYRERLSQIEHETIVRQVQALSFYTLENIAPLSVVSHLCSVGCVELERGVSRRLSSLVSSSRFSNSSFPEQFRNQLGNVWMQMIQHLTLTPVGLLIGILVHDRRAGTNFLETWEWEGITPVEVPFEAWFRDKNSPEFRSMYRELQRQLEDEGRRGRGFGYRR